MNLLGNKFRKTDRINADQLTRDLISVITELERQLEDIKSRLDALENQ